MVSVTQSTPQMDKSISPYILDKFKWFWLNVFHRSIYPATLYGLWVICTKAKWETWIFVFTYAGLLLTAKIKRLWNHHLFKSKLPIRILLMLLFSAYYENDIYSWVKEYRIYNLRDNDKHPNRKKQTQAFVEEEATDLSNIEDDPILRFHRKYNLVLNAIMCFAIPIFVPYYFWTENLWNAYFVANVFKYFLILDADDGQRSKNAVSAEPDKAATGSKIAAIMAEKKNNGFEAEKTLEEYNNNLATNKNNYNGEPNLTTEPIQERKIVWKNIALFSALHIASLYGIWIVLFSAKWKTGIYMYLAGSFYGLGITAGAHRLWAHKAYKARLPLRILLMILQTASIQNHIYEWVRDHRVHHRFTDTDADPHNSTRGFFFSHMGWLLVRKHRDVMVKGKTVDMSDLEADPIVSFQKKYYFLMAPLICFVLTPLVPIYLWGENSWNSFIVTGITRHIIGLHFTWLVNSMAHIYGNKPYNKMINPSENALVAHLSQGEGWHNYHHVFPWDYKAAELGNYSLNFTLAFIDFMASIGWAYDLKTVSLDMIKRRVGKTGDGSWVEQIPKKG